MPVSGLVVSLKSDPQLREEAIAAIRSEPRIDVGTIEHRRMAIVMDTTSTDEDKQLWCWLGSLPGVVFVDVALVGYEEVSPTPPCNAQTHESRPTNSRTPNSRPSVIGAANNGC